MSKGGIKINISGGDARFGNIVQGNYTDNSHSIGMHDEKINSIFESGMREIEALASKDAYKITESEIIESQLIELRKTIDKPNNDKEKSIGTKAKEIYENYGWAAKPLREIFDALGIAW